MLSNQRRRCVLYYLNRNPGPVPLRDLAERIAAWENDVEVAELEYKQRKRVYTSLHQTHLPKLNDAGIVDYDRDRGTVSLDDAARELEVYMEIVPEKELPWSVYYLGLAVLSLVLVPLVWLDVFPFAGFPDVALAALVALAFVASASLPTYYSGDVRLGSAGPPPTAPSQSESGSGPPTPSAVEDAGDDS